MTPKPLKKIKEVRFKRGVHRINFPVHETNPYEAIRKIESLNLPKHRVIGYEFKIYKGKDGFTATPEVYILK